MNDFNEHNYLCHYGIKGMKWGIRRYQNQDGSLTSEGIHRYGSKKGLKKHIKSEQERAFLLGKRASSYDYAHSRAQKQLSKYEEKLGNKLAKSGRRKNELTEKESRKLGILRGTEKETRKLRDKSVNEMKKHYNSLVKEFGKSSVNNIVYDKNGLVNEKVRRGRDWVKSTAVSVTMSAALTAMMMPAAGMSVTAVYIPKNRKDYGRDIQRAVKKDTKKTYNGKKQVL